MRHRHLRVVALGSITTLLVWTLWPGVVFAQLNVTGSWTGTWRSSRFPGTGTVSVRLTQVGTQFNGSIVITGSPFFTTGTVSGTVGRTNLAFGSVFSGGFQATFSGSLTPTSVSGFYTATGPGLNDQGTFQVTRATPAVQPSTLLPKSRVTTVAEPINVADGNMFTAHQDLLIPSRGPPLELTRTYNSRDHVEGPFGFGWRSSYDIELLEFADGTVLETDVEGTETLYTRQPDGSYLPSPGSFSRLTKHVDGSFTLVRKHGLQLSFDAQGRFTTIQDRNGNILTITYLDGVISQVTDGSGHNLRFIPSAQGKIAEVRDPAGRAFRYEYDPSGNLSALVDPLGQRTQYQYDVNHNLVTLIDANSHATHFAYDALDRAIASFQEGDVNRVDLQYVSATTTIAKDSKGNQITYEFNGFGLITRLSDSQGHVQQSTYDADLNRTSFTNQNERTTAFTYDARGNLLSVTDPLGHRTLFTYEPVFDFVTSVTDPLGRTTTYAYESKGNLVRARDTLGQTTVFAYDAFGNLTGLVDALGHVTGFTYDVVGNLTQVADATGSATMFAYDPLGNPVGITDANGNATTFTYDLLDQLTTVTYPDGSSVRYVYDATGNLSRFIDPKGQAASYAYDVADRLVQVTDAQGGLTRYEYDTEGNRTALIDARGSTTRYLYDSLNRLIKTLDPLGHETQFGYDPEGNLTTRTDANGHTTTFTYDANDRLVRLTYPDATVVAFGYDVVGNRTTMTDGQGITTFTYDTLNRLIQADGPQPNDTVSYTYDAVGNRTSMTDPDGGVTTYTYDTLNRLIALTDPQSRTTTYTYDAVSNLTQLQLPNQTKTTYSYDALNRLMQLTNLRLHGDETEPISSFTYRHDLASLRTQVTLHNGDFVTYSYDALNRLTNEVKRKAEPERVFFSNQYQYDTVGNRTTLLRQLEQRPPLSFTEKLPDPFQLPGQASFTYTYNTANQLTRIQITREDNAFVVDYTYDANGNLTRQTITNPEEPEKVDVTTYAYDFESRLTQVTLPDGSMTTYTYDGLGRRIRAETPGKITNFLYDGLLPILERNGEDRTTARYIRGVSLGGGIGGLLSAMGIADEEPVFYHYDGQGNVAELTDHEGDVVQAASYDAFGNLLSLQNDEVANPYLFSTKEFEPRSGLSYFGARYYDPRIGRWLTKEPVTWGPDDPQLSLHVDIQTIAPAVALLDTDPVAFQSAVLRGYKQRLSVPGSVNPQLTHPYVYASNNPIIYLDPTGEWGITGAIVGAVAGGVGGFITGRSVKGAVVGAIAGAAIGFVNPAAPFRYFLGAVGSRMVSQAVGAAMASAVGQVLGNKVSGNPAFRSFSPGAVAGAALGSGLAASATSKAGAIATAKFGKAVGNIVEGVVDGIPTGVGERLGKGLNQSFSKRK